MAKSNTNVLTGIKCPMCQSLEPFIINTSCWATVNDDGIVDSWEHEWQGNSSCTCGSCNYTGLVRNFEPKVKAGAGSKKGNPKAKK